MLNVGLTGNAASGKSTVADWFREWGATVIDADALVREAQAPGTATFAAIRDHFGDDILTPDGTLDRAALRHRVFADDAARRDLEAILHPAVRARRDALAREAARRGDRILVSEIPLLFETMDPDAFDAVVFVDAPAATRRARLVRERGLAPATADRLMASQLPAAAKRAQSTLVIDNDGSLATLRHRARGVWEALLARA